MARILVIVFLSLFLLADLIFGIYPATVDAISRLSLKRRPDRYRLRDSSLFIDHVYANRPYTSPAYFRLDGTKSFAFIKPSEVITQINRVALARSLTPEQIIMLTQLVTQFTEMHRRFMLTSSMINLMKLNAAIDSMFGTPI